MSWFIGEELQGRMFLMDDCTPFGIEFPEEYLRLLKKYNKDVRVFDANELAEDLAILSDVQEPVTLLGKGGALAYALLSRSGFRPDFCLADIQRFYEKTKGEKKARIRYEMLSIPEKPGNTVIDDVIASGETFGFAAYKMGLQEPDAMVMIISGDKRGGGRTKEGSTVNMVKDAYASRMASSTSGFPAIFSFRAMLRGLKYDAKYRSWFCGKYAGGNEAALRSVLNGVSTEPFELLYREPMQFIKEFGGRA